MAKAWPGSQGGTYGGNAVACAAAIATLDVIRDENLVENARTVGAVLASGLEKVAVGTSSIGDVRGLGLMLGNEFVTIDGQPDPAAASRAQQKAAELGLLLLTCGPFGNVVRMIPPLVVTEDQVEDGLEIWAGAVQSVASA
jgi:4-aminobutyrate aminotransferase